MGGEANWTFLVFVTERYWELWRCSLTLYKGPEGLFICCVADSDRGCKLQVAG